MKNAIIRNEVVLVRLDISTDHMSRADTLMLSLCGDISDYCKHMYPLSIFMRPC